MRQSKTDLRVSIDYFQKVLNSARQMLGTDRVEFIAPDQPERCVGWVLLFRAMNLGEAAVLAASRGLGETVALVTRSLEELAYLVGSLGNHLERAYDFLEGGAQTHANWLERRSRNFPGADPNMKLRMRKATEEHRKYLPLEPVDWIKKIKDRAKAAGMEDDYALHYYVFSEQAHHGPRAFDAYVELFHDGIQVRQKMNQFQTTLHFVYAACYCHRAMTHLLDALGVERTAAFESASEAYAAHIAGPEDV